MKENKDCQVKVRITKSEKERIEKYCQDAELTISQFIRIAIKEYFGGK